MVKQFNFFKNSIITLLFFFIQQLCRSGFIDTKINQQSPYILYAFKPIIMLICLFKL